MIYHLHIGTHNKTPVAGVGPKGSECRRGFRPGEEGWGPRV